MEIAPPSGGRRRQHALESFSGRERCRQDWMFGVDDLIGGAGDTFVQRPYPIRAENAFGSYDTFGVRKLAAGLRQHAF
ncbi:MAG: hypothetical protein ACRERD_25365 [Candidatus Binatia bacterium]